MVEFLPHWTVIAGIGFGVILLFHSQIFAGLKSATSLLPRLASSPKDGVTDDAADLAAFHRLTHRFERMKCKAGLDAMKVAGTHFLACPEIVA